MRIPLHRSGHLPLWRQIQQFLREEIRSGALPPHTRLPATRELAELLGVNRITVTNAYAELESEGLIYGRIGSGTFVAAAAPAGLTATESHSWADWPRWQQEVLCCSWVSVMRQLDEMAEAWTRPGVISFACGKGDPAQLQTGDFARSLAAVLHRDGERALGYGHPAGYRPLRTTIAQILSSQGIPVSPDRVLITSGSQQALELVARLLLRPGDVVVTECPTYFGAIDLFRSMGVRLVGIPLDEHGMMVERLEDTVRATRPRLIYTIPTFHNPTGTCLSSTRREQLVALAARYEVPILEDDFVGDLPYDGQVLPALKALDPGGWVMYVGTFSKMLAPALRLGFLVASGPVFDQLLSLKRITDLSTSTLLQRALNEYVTVGRYHAHLRRTCRAYRHRRDAMEAALRRCLPPGVRWRSPRGGIFIWLELPDPWTAEALYPLAVAEGVAFSPGSVFMPSGRPQPYLRLNFASHPPDVIAEGIERLGRAFHRLESAAGRRAGRLSDYNRSAAAEPA